MKKSTVAIIKNEVYESASNALSTLNLQDQLKPNYKILIKPNLVRAPSCMRSYYSYEEGTYETCLTDEGDIIRREVLEGILKFLKNMGISQIFIGEAAGGCETPITFEYLDLYDLSSKYGAELIDLNYADSIKVPVSNGYLLKEIWIPKIVRDVDFRISLTTYKVNAPSCGVSFGLKNWGLGILPGKYYGFNKALASHKKGLIDPLPIHRKYSNGPFGQEVEASQVLPDVCATQRFEISIIDALIAVHYDRLAPDSKQVTEKMDLIIAGNDPVATDAVSSYIGMLDPERILHIKWAADKNLGTMDLSKIEVKGQRISDVRKRLNPPFHIKDIMLD